MVLILSHVNEQPMQMLKNAGCDRLVGEDNFCANIDESLLRAKSITEK